MKDIVILVGIPAIILGVTLLILMRKNRKIARGNTPELRVKKIAMRPRAIRDINHKLSPINDLMEVNQDKQFEEEITCFIQANLARHFRVQ